MSRWICHNGVWKDGAGNPIPVAPMQVTYYGAGSVPFEVAAEAFKEYAAQYGTSQSLARLNERGGFGASELAILLFERIHRLQRASGQVSEVSK